MNNSELINKLIRLLELHGDLPVMFENQPDDLTMDVDISDASMVVSSGPLYGFTTPPGFLYIRVV